MLPPNLINIKIAKKPLKHKKCTKYLGVILDDKLTWKNHIGNINLKIRRGIGILSKVKDFVSLSTLKSLYYSCIYPYLDYNLLNWSSTSTSNLNCLRFSIKKAVHVILSKNKQEHSTPLFKKLQILPLDELIKFKRCIFMWKLDNNMLPESSTKWFTTNNSDIIKRLNLSKYRIPNPRTEHAKRHNTYSATKLWNTEIPNIIKSSFTINKLKSSYKTKLLSEIYN